MNEASNVVDLRPQQVVFRQVHLTESTLQLLGEHALTLPANHPARAAIRLLLHRAAQSPVYAPRTEQVAA